MLSRPIRALGHVGAVVLLSGLALLAAGTAGQASSPSAKPDTYGGDATAASLELHVDKQPFPFPVTDPFHTWVPYAETSTDSSGGSEGIASSVYPGQGFIGVPALICEFAAQLCHSMPGGKPPDYPDWAHAQYPAHPDDTAQVSQKPFPGTGPFEVTPNSVTAHADLNRVEATTVTGSAGVTGVVTVQSATSHSLQTFQGGALVMTTESVLKGVDIGGQLHIDQIASTATAKVDGKKVGASSATTTVSGATVAGQAVSIDSTGIHVVGHSDNGLVTKTVNTALASLAKKGFQVRSLGNTKSARPAHVAAETGGLLVMATQDVNAPSVPIAGGSANGRYTITATLGGAGVTGFASPAVPLPSLGAVAPPAPPAAPAATGRGGGGAVAPPPAPQTATASNPGSTPDVASPTATPRPRLAAADLTWKKVRLLALVLLAYPMLVVIARPFRAPSRLPGGG